MKTLLINLLEKLKKDDWGLVKTYDVKVRYRGVDAVIYYYLYESRKGKRRVEYKSSVDFLHFELDTPEKVNFYLKTIYPWLNGVFNVDIPKYSDIPQENLIKVLKGK